MSVDYGMEIVYGFKLDREKLKESFGESVPDFEE